MLLRAGGKRQRLQVEKLRSSFIVMREEGLRLANTENIYL
jgi:hypothetical protein